MLLWCGITGLKKNTTEVTGVTEKNIRESRALCALRGLNLLESP